MNDFIEQAQQQLQNMSQKDQNQQAQVNKTSKI